MPGCNGDYSNMSEDYAPHLYDKGVYVGDKKIEEPITSEEKRCNVKVKNVKLRNPK